MRDMPADSCATISVARCYIIRSKLQGLSDAETDARREKKRRARFQERPADHGAARSPGPALEPAHPLGTARRAADLAQLARRLRRSLADRAAGATVRIARGRLCRTGAGGRISPHRIGPRTARNLPAAASLRRAMEQTSREIIYAAATVRLAPSACTILTRLPAGVSGPATRQMVSSILTVPAPSMIGFSSVNTRPTSASARRLRNGLLRLTALLESATRRHSGTAQAAKIANIRICICQDGSSANDNSPTSRAASPSQNRNTPGASNSSAISTTPKISQFQVPSVANMSVMVAPLLSNLSMPVQHPRCAPSPMGRGLG